MYTSVPKTVAISRQDMLAYGCPHCGTTAPLSLIDGDGQSAIWGCGKEGCGRRFCVLAKGVRISTVALDGVFAELSRHPRRKHSVRPAERAPTPETIAVAVSEHRLFGCPHCGYRSGYSMLSVGGAATWQCADSACQKSCVILADGLNRSPIGIGFRVKSNRGVRDVTFYPKLQQHPRRGIPAHGAQDKRPEDGGEFFYSRGLGLDRTSGCFVCGGGEEMRPNIAAFVQCKEAGERVVGMFPQGARLDFRNSSPDRVQVKIGACKRHKANLEHLHVATEDGVLTAARIADARR